MVIRNIKHIILILPIHLRRQFNSEGYAFSSFITVKDKYQDIEIPLLNLKQDSCLLLPRPYPGFQPLWFKAQGSGSFSLLNSEKIEISFGYDFIDKKDNDSVIIEIKSVILK